MKPSISTHLFVYHKLQDDHLRMICDAGFNTVEIWGARPHIDYHDPQRVDWLGNTCARLGIEIDSFHSPLYTELKDISVRAWLNLGAQDQDERQRAVDENKKLIETCAQLGSRVMVLHHCTDRSGAESDPFFADSLAELVQAAAGRVTLGIENLVHPYSVFANLKRHTEKYTPQEVSLTLDVGHSQVNSTPQQEIADGGKRIANLHIHDNDGQRDLHHIPGDGIIDWQRVKADLENIGFDAPFTQELRDPDRESDDPQRFVQILHKAKAAYEKIFSS
jgi:sugar phosphate isomerase/epimerase